MKPRMWALSAALTVSGIALACNSVPYPLPVIAPIEVDAYDLSAAWLDGYKTQAAFAAALKQLDEQASMLIGEANWTNNAFSGYLTYKVEIAGMRGANNIYVEKPCGAKAENQAERRTRNQTGTDGGDRTNVNPYATTTTGIVGYRPVVRTWTACAGDACSSGEYVEYEPIWGTVRHAV